MASESDSAATWAVTYHLEPEDLRTMHRLHMKNRYPRAPIYAAVLFTIFGAGIGWLIGTVADRSRPVGLAIGAGAGLMLFRWLIRNAERRTIRQGEEAGFFTEQTLTLNAEGCQHTFEDGRTFIRPWRTIRKLGKSSGYLVFFTDEEFAVLAVPLRAFESEAAADLFIMVAQHWQAKAIG